jgi:hypothetical protein
MTFYLSKMMQMFLQKVINKKPKIFFAVLKVFYKNSRILSRIRSNGLGTGSPFKHADYITAFRKTKFSYLFVVYIWYFPHGRKTDQNTTTRKKGKPAAKIFTLFKERDGDKLPSGYILSSNDIPV